MSPFASSGTSSASVESTTPAGTISQIARGAVELRDEILERRRARRAFFRERLHRRRRYVVHDALVAGLHQPAHHVRAHSAEADHSELHRGSSIFEILRAARFVSVSADFAAESGTCHSLVIAASERRIGGVIGAILNVGAESIKPQFPACRYRESSCAAAASPCRSTPKLRFQHTRPRLANLRVGRVLH